MIVECRNGDTALIVKDNVCGQDAVIFAENNWTELSGFSDDLRWSVNSMVPEFCRTIDIMKVFKPDLPIGFLSRKSKFSDDGKMKLLWERPEEVVVLPEYTMEELVQKLGFDFKIKK